MLHTRLLKVEQTDETKVFNPFRNKQKALLWLAENYPNGSVPRNYTLLFFPYTLNYLILFR